MRQDIPDELQKSCSLCEFARRIETTGQTICTQSGVLKKVSPESVCRKFRFDILSYRPLPLKIPKFNSDI